jgi:hypothetical protein
MTWAFPCHVFFKFSYNINKLFTLQKQFNMKRKFLSIMICIFATMLIINCKSANSDKTEKNGTKTITAKFLDAGSLEGEATLTFEKEDGSKIDFFRNYTNSDEPKLKYEFLSEEGIGGNKELIGSTFIINYIEKSNGGATGKTIEGEPCNQILSIEKK